MRRPEDLLTVGCRDRTVDTLTVSDLTHFLAMAELVRVPKAAATIPYNDEADELLAVLQGFAISAGSGTPTALPAAREALIITLEQMSPYPFDKAETRCRSISDVANALTTLLSAHQSDDRVLIPILETIAFLLDFGILQRLHDGKSTGSPPFRFRTLLSLVQKAHFKSTNTPKLAAAVNVYSGLLELSEIRIEVLTKLTSMLLHPFPSIRVEAAKALWMATKDADLKPRKWTSAPAEHKTFVTDFKERYCRV